MELTIAERDTDEVVAVLLRKTVEKLLSFIQSSSDQQCSIEIPLLDRSATLRKRICEQILKWFRDRGFDMHERSTRSQQYIISWKHVALFTQAVDRASHFSHSTRLHSLHSLPEHTTSYQAYRPELTASELSFMQNAVQKEQQSLLLKSLLEECDAQIQQCIQEGKHHSSSCMFKLPLFRDGIKLDRSKLYDEMVKDLKERNFSITEESPLKQGFRISWEQKPTAGRVPTPRPRSAGARRSGETSLHTTRPTKSSFPSTRSSSHTSANPSHISVPSSGSASGSSYVSCSSSSFSFGSAPEAASASAASVPAASHSAASASAAFASASGRVFHAERINYHSLSPLQLIQEFKNGIVHQYQLSLQLRSLTSTGTQTEAAQAGRKMMTRQLEEVDCIMHHLSSHILKRMSVPSGSR